MNLTFKDHKFIADKD